ncbi:hypothetical protein EMIT0133MI5_20155 [Bacillus velezensis]
MHRKELLSIDKHNTSASFYNKRGNIFKLNLIDMFHYFKVLLYAY